MSGGSMVAIEVGPARMRAASFLIALTRPIQAQESLHAARPPPKPQRPLCVHFLFPQSKTAYKTGPLVGRGFA
jgi:hypothetical protein